MAKAHLDAFRAVMDKKNIDYYIINTSDYHGSEYVSDYFKSREYLSDFTGSNGDLLVMKDKAILWTDGRYFIQAENEMASSGVELYKMGVEGFPTMRKYIEDNLDENETLAFDPRTMDLSSALELKKIVDKKQAKIDTDSVIIDEIWEGRPSFPSSSIYHLDLKYTGLSSDEKLKVLRNKLNDLAVDTHIISSLHEIAWLFNLRASDIAYTPVAISYAIVTLDKVHLFCNVEKIEKDLKEILLKNKVNLHDYSDFYDFLTTMEYDNILIDKSRINYKVYLALEGKKVRFNTNPIIHVKAVKNEVEIENTKKAHIKDGLAVAKFMHWLKTNYKDGITEIEAEDKIYEFRKENAGLIDLSFNSISATGANAAMMHYSAKRENSTLLKEGDLYLLDSGAHYYEGTTDITRTFAIGEICDEYKKHFTMVLQGVINLSLAKFLYGCRGTALDILSRQVFWDIGLDYRSGTGHGVGYVLGVHEGPNGFRWREIPGRDDNAVLEHGMITTVEPGIYIDGSHGIRTENMLLCINDYKNEYGQFMKFENIAIAPIDIDAIDVSMLSETQRKYLNDYHKEVYDKLSKDLNDEQREFLRKYTREI